MTQAGKFRTRTMHHDRDVSSRPGLCPGSYRGRSPLRNLRALAAPSVIHRVLLATLSLGANVHLDLDAAVISAVVIAVEVREKPATALPAVRRHLALDLVEWLSVA